MPTRIINVTVTGEYVSKDNKNAGVVGEANVTSLNIALDETWTGFGKRIIWLDAEGQNPVAVVLYNTLEEILNGTDELHLVTHIPSEPLAKAGWCSFVIEGFQLDGTEKVAYTATDKLQVKPNDKTYTPAEPTASQTLQLQKEIDNILPSVVEAIGTATENLENAQAAISVWGVWDSSTRYEPLNKCVRYGNSYICTATNINVDPSVDVGTGVEGTYWMLIAAKGDRGGQGNPGLTGLQGVDGVQGNEGEQGNPGENGRQGDTGPVNVLSIGTVTDGETSSATITGVSPRQILNLVLRRGEKGDPGTDAKDLELQKTATHIQVRYVGGEWADLVALADITGPQGDAGNGIASIVLLSGDHSAGTSDTYRITFTDSTVFDLDVYNGSNGTNGIDGDDGRGIASVALVSGNHAAGTFDKYRITFTDNEIFEFDVYNGGDGEGAGDMLSTVYDPTGKNADAFSRANHTGTQLASTISNFAATVLATVLAGLSTATNAVISATDSVLSALGKLQAQITAHKNDKNNPHEVTAAQVGAIPTSQKGAANGVAELGADGFVLTSQLPSFVDDVLEYASAANFPATGESGKIYVALDTNKTYRWSGSAYVEISASIVLGETSGTAYRGDRGKTAYDHSQATGNPHSTTPADIGAATNTHGHGNINNDGTIVSGDAGDVLCIMTSGGPIESRSKASAGVADRSHTHGNLTNDGKIGTVAGKVITTGTDGLAQAQTIAEAGLVASPSAVTGTDAITITVEENKEYAYTLVSSLTMTGAAVNCHGFIRFSHTFVPGITVSGFDFAGGDDITTAGADEDWEFSVTYFTYSGTSKSYIVWKKWS